MAASKEGRHWRTALVEGKLYLFGGQDGQTRSNDVLQFNMGGFQMEFDGEDDEIMVPHLPTIIPTQYTVEAWARRREQRHQGMHVSGKWQAVGGR